jgi:hypothetical protein
MPESLLLSVKFRNGGASGSGCFFDRSHPADDKEVLAAKAAAKGQKEPVERPLDRVSGADASEIDGFAVGTTGE